MTALALANSAYGRVVRDTASDSAVEARLLRQSAAEIATESKDGFRLDSASAQRLSDNLILWDAFASDLLSSGNTLPDALRTSLLSLGSFVRQHTHALYSGRTRDTSALVDINLAIAAGLDAQARLIDAEAVQ